ncbi:MAG: hypothetical protein COW63_06870, partial [Bacteroidetes bacterium CG18_big_fil_WC_8_21_14_2_50_41_14]
MRYFPFTKQLDAMDCGPACLRMVARHHGKAYSLQKLRVLSHITREGVSLLGVSDAAERIGFRSMGVKIAFEKLAHDVPLPCIAHWKQRHFVVVYDITGKKGNETIKVADPAHGLVNYTREEFLKGWLSTARGEEDQGICLLLESSPDFYTQE